MSAESIAPTLNSMPAAANATSAVPAHSRPGKSSAAAWAAASYVASFLAAGGVGWVAGRKLLVRSPLRRSPFPAQMLPGRWMDAGWTLRGKHLRGSARISSGSSGTAGADWIGETTEQPVCTFGCVYPCRLSVSVWHSVCREAALTARDARGYCDSTCRLNGVRMKR